MKILLESLMSSRTPHLWRHIYKGVFMKSFFLIFSVFTSVYSFAQSNQPKPFVVGMNFFCYETDFNRNNRPNFTTSRNGVALIREGELTSDPVADGSCIGPYSYRALNVSRSLCFRLERESIYRPARIVLAYSDKLGVNTNTPPEYNLFNNDGSGEVAPFRFENQYSLNGSYTKFGCTLVEIVTDENI